MAYRRRGGPKGRKCVRRRRVRVRGQGYALRCAKYGAKRSGTKRSGGRKRRRGGYRKPAGMARKGSTCKRYRRVRVKGHGYARRCASYRR